MSLPQVSIPSALDGSRLPPWDSKVMMSPQPTWTQRWGVNGWNFNFGWTIPLGCHPWNPFRCKCGSELRFRRRTAEEQKRQTSFWERDAEVDSPRWILPPPKKQELLSLIVHSATSPTIYQKKPSNVSEMIPLMEVIISKTAAPTTWKTGRADWRSLANLPLLLLQLRAQQHRNRPPSALQSTSLHWVGAAVKERHWLSSLAWCSCCVSVYVVISSQRAAGQQGILFFLVLSWFSEMSLLVPASHLPACLPTAAQQARLSRDKNKEPPQSL